MKQAQEGSEIINKYKISCKKVFGQSKTGKYIMVNELSYLNIPKNEIKDYIQNAYYAHLVCIIFFSNKSINEIIVEMCKFEIADLPHQTKIA